MNIKMSKFDDLYRAIILFLICLGLFVFGSGLFIGWLIWG